MENEAGRKKNLPSYLRHKYSDMKEDTTKVSAPQGTTGRRDVPGTVCLLIERNDAISTTVLAVYADLQDANEACLRRATMAGVSLTSGASTMGPDKSHIKPIEPVRWDTPEGDSCWVEIFEVEPQRIL